MTKEKVPNQLFEDRLQTYMKFKFTVLLTSLNHLLLRLISTLVKLEISTLLKTITNSGFQALEGLKFRDKQTQKQMIQTFLRIGNVESRISQKISIIQQIKVNVLIIYFYSNRLF